MKKIVAITCFFCIHCYAYAHPLPNQKHTTHVQSAQTDKPCHNRENNVVESNVIQTIIRSPTLTPFFHLDHFPERSPLSVYFAAHVLPCQYVEKFGPANTVSHNIDNTLVVDSFNRSAHRAEVTYTYKPEGIQGTVILERQRTGWKEIKHDIIER